MHFLPKNTFLRRISSSAGVSPPFSRRILWLGFCNHPLALSTPLTHQPPWLCRWRGPPPRHECPLTHLQSLQFVILLTYSSFRRFLCIFWYLVLSATFASLKYFFGRYGKIRGWNCSFGNLKLWKLGNFELKRSRFEARILQNSHNSAPKKLLKLW